MTKPPAQGPMRGKYTAAQAWARYLSRPETASGGEVADSRTRVAGRFGLGLGLRIKIAIEHSGLTYEKFADTIGLVDRESLKRAVRPAEEGEIDPSIVSAVVAWLASRGFTPSRTDFEHEIFTGPRAVSNFAAWIRDGKRAPETDVSLLGPLSEDDVDAASHIPLQDLQEFLSVEEDEAGRDIHRTVKTLQFVIAEGPAHANRILTERVIQLAQSADLDRPVLALPIGRNMADKGRTSRRSLISALLAFCQRRSLDGPCSIRSTEDEHAAMTVIRDTLARHPAVIVFSDWSPPPVRLQHLHALIANDDLAEVLTQLLLPYRGPDATLVDPTIFEQNRFVVVADRDVPLGRAFRPVDAVRAPSPSASVMDAIIASGRTGRELAELPNEAADESPEIATKRRTLQERVALLKRLSATPAFQGDDAMALVDDLARLQPDFSADALGDLLLAETHPFRRMVERWIAAQKVDGARLVALRYLALSEDGVRLTSLRLFLSRWARLIEPGAPSEWQVGNAGSSFTTTEALVAPLVDGGTLVRGRDAPIPGLDNPEAPYVHFDDDETLQTLGPVNDALAHFDFVSSRLRDEVIRQMLAEGPDDLIARAHRLVAEESIAQHTEMARQGDWASTFSATHYRRLAQGLFHGFASVAVGRNAEDLRLRLLPGRVLPSGNRHAYERLHAVFFRALMESPPGFELSRVLGREDLKIDLLLLAMNVDQSETGRWSRIYGLEAEFDPGRSGFFTTGHEVGERVYADQLTSLARAAYHHGQLDIAAQALNKFDDLKKTWRLPQPPPWQTSAAADAAKLRTDVMIIQATPESLQNVDSKLESQFRESGLDKSFIEAIEGLAKRQSEVTDGIWSLDKDVRDLVATVTKKDLPASVLIGWSDLLSRAAEVHALKDLQSVTSQYLAFLTFFVAERLRRKAFSRDPLGRGFYINAHATRVMVRVLLRLIRLLRRPQGRSHPEVPAETFLAAQARRHMDMLARYLSRYPTERASLLIAQAAWTRVAGDDSPEALKTAERLLAEADKVLASTVSRPRVRLRFLMDRARVYAARAGSEGLKDDDRRRLLKAAASDVRAFRGLTTVSRLPAWEAKVTAVADYVSQRRQIALARMDCPPI